MTRRIEPSFALVRRSPGSCGRPAARPTASDGWSDARESPLTGHCPPHSAWERCSVCPVRTLEATTVEQVEAAAPLYDGPPVRPATNAFLADPRHYLLVALDDDGRTLGFISGVEMTHPDKGTEMFLYELAVAEDARQQGIGLALTASLETSPAARGVTACGSGSTPTTVRLTPPTARPAATNPNRATSSPRRSDQLVSRTRTTPPVLQFGVRFADSLAVVTDFPALSTRSYRMRRRSTGAPCA